MYFQLNSWFQGTVCNTIDSSGQGKPLITISKLTMNAVKVESESAMCNKMPQIWCGKISPVWIIWPKIIQKVKFPCLKDLYTTNMTLGSSQKQHTDSELISIFFRRINCIILVLFLWHGNML